MKKTIITAWLLAMVFSIHNVLAEEPLVVRANSEWPPMYWLDKDGKWQGESIEMYKALFEEAGVAYVFQNLPWSRALKGMETGQCHVMATLTPTEERAQFMYFIGPHEKEEMVILVREKDKTVKIGNLNELTDVLKKTGQQVGVQNDIFYSEEFNNRLKNDPEFASHFYVQASTNTTHEMVRAGRLFGYIEEKVALAWRVKTDSAYKGLTVHPFILSSTDLYFGVSKKTSPEIVEKLKKANERLLKNGTYDKIGAKWRE